MKPKPQRKWKLLHRENNDDRYGRTDLYRRGRMHALLTGMTTTEARELARDLGATFVRV